MVVAKERSIRLGNSKPPLTGLTGKHNEESVVTPHRPSGCLPHNFLRERRTQQVLFEFEIK